jgi:hypothetical protein
MTSTRTQAPEKIDELDPLAALGDEVRAALADLVALASSEAERAPAVVQLRMPRARFGLD